MAVIRDKIHFFNITSESDTGECRRKCVSFAGRLGFSDLETGEVAIIVTEMVSNVVKHGGGTGRLMICRIRSEDLNTGLELWCCDSGEGFSDINLAMQDGYTNTATLGIGLGSMRRLSDEFEINPEKNIDFVKMDSEELQKFKTCIRTRKWLKPRRVIHQKERLQIGVSSRPKPGEEMNGDDFVVLHPSPALTLAAVMDGLGHGKDAFIASRAARDQIVRNSQLPVDKMISVIHENLRGTRGVTIGILRIDTAAEKLAFAGIGNIDGMIWSKSKKTNLISYGGIVGHKTRAPRVFEFDFGKGDHVCLYSDGIISRWQYDEIDWKNHPQAIAEQIINQYSRISDDATILIIGYTS